MINDETKKFRISVTLLQVGHFKYLNLFAKASERSFFH